MLPYQSLFGTGGECDSINEFNHKATGGDSLHYGYQTWSEESMMQIYDDYDPQEVKGYQRSNMVNYVLSFPNLVTRIPYLKLLCQILKISAPSMNE